MFTLFFAGETFAPLRKVKRERHAIWAKEAGGQYISIQEFLQNSMVEAFGQLADRLAEFRCVIGFEVGQFNVLIHMLGHPFEPLNLNVI